MLVDTQKAAEMLGVKASSLAVLRSRGTGAPYVVNGRAVFYDTADLKEYKFVKFATAKNSSNYRKTYLIRITKGGEVQGVLKRKAESLPHALAELSLYPSMKGCEFEDITAPVIKPGIRDRVIEEVTAIKPELKKAMLAVVGGNNSAAKQAGQRKFERLIDTAIKKAFKAPQKRLND